MGELDLSAATSLQKEKQDAARLEWSPQEHDHVAPGRICPHSSGPWGGPVSVPTELAGKIYQQVGNVNGLSYSRCNRKCAKFMPDPDDDPTNKESGAKGSCADVVTANSLKLLTQIETTEASS